MTHREIFVDYGYLRVTTMDDMFWFMDEVYEFFNKGCHLKLNITTYRKDKEEKEEEEKEHKLGTMSFDKKIVEYDYFWLTTEAEVEYFKKEIYTFLTNGWELKMDFRAYRKPDTVKELQEQDQPTTSSTNTQSVDDDDKEEKKNKKMSLNNFRSKSV